MLGLKPQIPESFPDLEFSQNGPTIPEGVTPTLLTGGYNSSAWRVGSEVVKVTAQAKNPADAAKLRNTMQREHEVLERFLGDYMPETEYSLGLETESNGVRVVTAQPFIEGTSLPVFWARLDSPTGPLHEFLAKSKEVFKTEKLMPDIACIEDSFNVLNNSNILIREDEEAAPVLVDTTFGKTQRSRSLGPFWTRFIYAGAVIADAKLQLERE